jgi:hypothetical protein
MKRMAIPVVLVSFLCGPLYARNVNSEGLGITRDAAILNAMRNAVEKCVGLSISSATIVENATTVSDKILTHCDGYISSYSVTWERREFGLVNVEISADVSMGKLESDLAAQKLLYEIKNKPRIMVLLDERLDGKEMFGKTATFKFGEILLSRGFIVVEPEQLEKNSASNAGGMGIEDLADLAFKHGADLIIRGEVSVSKPTPKMIYGVQFQAVPVQMNARILRTDNAQILASKTKRISKNSREAESAAQFGLETGGTELANDLLDSLNKYWQSEAYNENRIEVVVSGCDDKALHFFEESLANLPVTRSVRIRYIEDDRALFDMDIRGTVQDLRAAAGKKGLEGFFVASLTANRITFIKGSKAVQVSYGEDAGVVEITALSLSDIFPSRIRAYETQPLAGVGILNGKKALDNVKLSVIIPDIMRLSADTNINSLPPLAARTINVPLLLDNAALLSNTESRTVYGQASLSFGQGSASVQRKLTAPVLIHDKNAMDWNMPDAIGGFVTFRDPVVADMAGIAVRSADIVSSVNRDMLNAMAIFAAVKTSGAGYVKDPSSKTGKTNLDRIQYPRETLKRKSGDCDDLAVLYAALLEAAGIQPAIISYSDHVLVMFNTGIYEKNRLSISPDTLQTISHNGTLWIPVETTMIGKGFVDAWHSASREFHSSLKEGRRIDIIDLEKAWQAFSPVPLPQTDIEISIDGCDKTFATELDKLEKSIQSQLAGSIEKLSGAGGKSIEALNSMGVLSAARNDISQAVKYFEQAIKHGSSIEYRSNYACALLLSGDDAKASSIFNDIWKKDNTGRIAVNRALCMFVSAQTPEQMESFVKFMKEAAAMMPSPEKLSQYLGIDLLANELSKGEDKNQSQNREVNLRLLQEIIRKRVLSEPIKPEKTISDTTTGKRLGGTTTESSTGTRADKNSQVFLPFGGIRGADPTQVAKIQQLLYWFE